MLTFLKSALLYSVLLVWLLAVVMPLLWVFASSLRSSREFVEDPFGIPWLITGSPYAENPDVDTPWEAVVADYHKAWVKSKFSRFFFNSVLVTTLSLAGIIGISSMASYVLAKFSFPGGRLVLL